MQTRLEGYGKSGPTAMNGFKPGQPEEIVTTERNFLNQPEVLDGGAG